MLSNEKCTRKGQLRRTLVVPRISANGIARLANAVTCFLNMTKNLFILCKRIVISSSDIDVFYLNNDTFKKFAFMFELRIFQSKKFDIFVFLF
jgi:hypothetical protein